MLPRIDRVLVLAPHHEDGEIGCGGTIARLADEGKDVRCAVFTAAEKSTPPPYPPDAQKGEMLEAMGLLGLGEDRLIFRNWEVRTFHEHRQEILDFMLHLRAELAPQLVFCHCRFDCHQDHQTITQEALRAFKRCSILGYELPWNTFEFRGDVFVQIDERHLERKARAVECYRSRSFRPYIDGRKIRSWMEMRGMQIEVDAAECFECIRWIDRLDGGP